MILDGVLGGDSAELQFQLKELERVVSQLWTRMNNADTLRLNRSMRRAFDIKELTVLSNGLIDNIMSDAENVSTHSSLSFFLFFSSLS